MEREQLATYAGSNRLVVLLLAALVLGIFAIDTLTDLEIAVAVLYVAVILLSARSLRPSGTLVLSGTCLAATVLSFLLTRRGSLDAGLINCGLSLFAIAATTYLSMSAQLAANAERQARARLAGVTRAAAIGELSASIAHEINQPLAALVVYGNAGLRWLAAPAPNLDKTREALEAIVGQAGRAGDVVNRIRSLAGGAAVPFQPLAINEVVAEGIALAREGLQAARVNLHTDFTPELPEILGDRVQLTQVVLNLFANATESVAGLSDGERNVFVTTRRFSPDQLAFMVRDNGAGIAPGKLDQVFDAFYTTKATGMGFGLAISRTFVEAHGGKIWAEQSRPQGALFVVSLPVVSPSNTETRRDEP